jgi:CRISPR-associated exonuclease Cas4
MNPDISISSVVTASVCPLRYYLDQKDARSPSSKYEVCKQVSYHVADQRISEEIWNELRSVHPDMDESHRAYLDLCLGKCRRSKSFRQYIETDLAVRSKRHGIFGVVDKILDGEPEFSIVKAQPAPKAGVYSSDRLRVFGYMLCLREMTGREIRGGCVEYIPDGVCRTCIPQPIDKRRFLRALDEARMIKRGEIPRKPTSPPCESCREADRCSPKGRRLSDLF